MSPQAFDFYLNDESVDPIGSVLFNDTHAIKVVDIQHVDEDKEKPRLGMICEDVMGQGSVMVVNAQNCNLYSMSIDSLPGPLQAIWAMAMGEIEGLKKKLRAV